MDRSDFWIQFARTLRYNLGGVLQDLALELNLIFERQKGYKLIQTGMKEDL